MRSNGEINRRRVIQAGAGLGLGLAGLKDLGGIQPASAAEALTLYHDKSPWQDLFIAMSEMSVAAGGAALDPVSFADTTSYQAALKPALSSNDAPDMFTWWSGYRFEDLYKEGVTEDLSDVWAQAVADGNLVESLASAFTFDGQAHAIPTTVSYWVVFYNMKVFADNGLTPPATWDEMIGAADTLKAAGITPFAASVAGRWPSFIWFEEMVMRTDPKFYEDLCAGTAKYTDPTAVQAMETWKGLIDAGYFTSFDLDLFADIPALFASGELAMIPVGTWYPGYAINPTGMVAGTDYGVFVMPNINPELTENVIIVETGALAVAKNGQNIEEAKKWVAWWVTPEAQTAWANKLGDVPANPKATSENPEVGKLLETLSAGNYRLLQRYWEASPVPIVEGAVDFLTEFMLNPGSMMDVLGKIQELADAEWAKRA